MSLANHLRAAKPQAFTTVGVISASTTTRWLLGVEDEALFAIYRSR
jgi:hypothetical protein